MTRKINVAIDGYSSTGKSSLARKLANKLGYAFVDTGAMYRSVTLYFLQNGIDYSDNELVSEALKEIEVQFQWDEQLQGSQTLLNGKVVDEMIRSSAVSSEVSEVSAIAEVRTFLVRQQQEMSNSKGIVMDGRDIGTVVLPDAELKLFMTTDFETRVDRRFHELKEKGIEMSREEVAANIEHRDYIDTHRESSPLYRADDAILIDNTKLTEEEQLKLTYNLAVRAIERAFGNLQD